VPFRVLLASGLVIKILQRTLSNRAYSKSGVDYLAKGGKHGRRERTLVPSARSNFTRPTLVDRLAIYGRLCQSGLVADSAGDSNLAVLFGKGTELAKEAYFSQVKDRLPQILLSLTVTREIPELLICTIVKNGSEE